MKITSLCVFVLFCCCTSLIATENLSGTWKSVRVASDGNHVETYFDLEQNGNHLSGKVYFAWGDLPLIEGRVHGNKFHFAAVIDNARFSYDGELVNGQLRLTLHDRNAPDASFTAERVAKGGFEVPPRVPPPALHTVPYNGLAATPPMGWNSWNHFHDRVDDAIIRSIADLMARNGMRDAGYMYVNIDDTWEERRDAQGFIYSNKKFPDMKALADYVHSKGLKLGIYSSPGPKTCGDYEGSYGHEEQDAKTFAEWGIDYLKYDWCSAFRIYKPSEMRAIYQKMGDALQASGRPIVYSLCQYGAENVWEWGPLVGGNLWRTTGDIFDSWKSMSDNGFSQDKLADYAGSGHWNDPDMLEIGNGGMTDEEYRTHMSLWSILAAPLMAGNDLRSMTPEILSILTNPEVIAIDQDASGKQGRRIKQMGQVEVWEKPLSSGYVALAVFNRGNATAKVSFHWSDFGLSKPVNVRDLWERRDVPSVENLSAELKPHGVMLLRLRTK
jgi:alpha-galactosidase